MCECGCADVPFEEVHQIKGTGVTIAVQRFFGCEDCDYGPSLSISVFDSPYVEWLDGEKPREITPDEFGGKSRGGRLGIGLSFFDPEDLRAEAKALSERDGCSIGPGDHQYATLEEWMGEFATQLIRGACHRSDERERKRRRRKRAR